jgi:hypothetical protein
MSTGIKCDAHAQMLAKSSQDAMINSITGGNMSRLYMSYCRHIN